MVGPSPGLGEAEAPPRSRSGLSSEAEVESEPLGRASQIIFHVTDTGTGIPAEKLPKIFDRFMMANDNVGVPLRSTGAYPAVSSIASINYQVLDIKLRNKSLRINT